MSKYTFLNKYIEDERFVELLVEIAYKNFGYDYKTPMEDLSNILIRFKENFKIDIKYSIQDFKNQEIISKYGLKGNTKVYAKHFSSNYFILLDKNTSYNDNRFLVLKIIAYILYDKFEKNEELRLTLESDASKLDQLAEHYAIEFLLPKWKIKYMKKQNQEIEKLKHFNSFLSHLRMEVWNQNENN